MTIQIFVKTYIGQITKTITIDCDTSDTILETKQKISTKLDIPCDRIRLTFCSRTLENNKKINDYNIGKESTLYAY